MGIREEEAALLVIRLCRSNCQKEGFLPCVPQRPLQDIPSRAVGQGHTVGTKTVHILKKVRPERGCPGISCTVGNLITQRTAGRSPGSELGIHSSDLQEPSSEYLTDPSALGA